MRTKVDLSANVSAMVRLVQAIHGDWITRAGAESSVGTKCTVHYKMTVNKVESFCVQSSTFGVFLDGPGYSQLA